jgi:predicted enzyme related to lactoylglutathione lyase
MPSNFIWYELMTSDLEAAEDFYRKVVGWDAEHWGGPDMRYVIMKPGGNERGVGGLMTIPEEAARMGAQPMWLGYIHARDIDAATESLRKAGGEVKREPTDIPEVGRFSVVTDPQGAMFMMMTPKGPDMPPVPPMTPGHVAWHELYAADGKSAFDFYAGQFGWTKGDAMDMGPMGTYQLFSAGGDAIGGMMTKPANVPFPIWVYYFTVPSIDEASKLVTDNGGQVLNGPMEVPGGAWIVQCMDPQGAMFALTAMKR